MLYSRFLLLFMFVSLMATPALADKCHSCHQSRDFKITNKNIYDYNVDFEISVHGIAQLECTDCHGGDSSTNNMKQAHEDVLAPVENDKITATCGECHQEQYDSFITSYHFKKLENNSGAPNCVTCHGAMDMGFIFASQVKNTCQFCHNHESGTFPEISGQADFVISKINIIKGYKEFVEAHAKDKDLVKELAHSYEKLTARWHSFDLSGVEADTRTLHDKYRRANAQAIKDRNN